MSFEFLIMNHHLAPFLILFFIGFFLLVLTPIHYRWRRKKIATFLTPLDLMRYNKFEQKALIIGIIFVLIGIIGSAFVSEKYGYNTFVYDLDGTKRIENSKEWGIENVPR